MAFFAEPPHLVEAIFFERNIPDPYGHIKITKMILLYYPPMTTEIAGWQERLEKMVIEYKLELQEKLAQPELWDGESHIQGTVAINAYLDKLEELIKSWYECRCDKYEF